MVLDRAKTFNISSLGLDIDECHIIEMACLITDENLNIVAEVMYVQDKYRLK